ncbi:MAG: glycosyltransferase family 4 protein [Candidatus Saccharimonadales bacterium]
MPKTLKIGFVLDDTIDSSDGVQQYVLCLGAWLAGLGHEVHYLCGQSARRDYIVHSLSRNIKVKFNGNRLSIPLPAKNSAIKALLAKEKFDVLHVQMPYSPWLAGKIIKAASTSKTAIIGTFHILPIGHLAAAASRGLALACRSSLASIDQVLAVSQPAAVFAKARFGLSCTVVPNVFQFHKFQNLTPAFDKNQPLTIVFLGRLVKRKGCQHLLNAALQLSNHRAANFKLVIAGRGPEAAKLQRFVAKHELKNLVEFSGFIAESGKPKLLAGADIAVFPSTGGESFGIVLLEALAASRGAVLAGNNPGYAGLMQGHEDQLFDPKNSAQLSAKLAYFMDEPGLRRQASAWQKQRAKAYDVNLIGPKIIDIYKNALNKRSVVR